MYLVPEVESYFHWAKMVEIRHIFRILVLKKYLFIFYLLAVLHSMWDLSSLTRHQTHAFCFESTES